MFVDEIEITGLFLDADLGNFFDGTAFFAAAGHFRTRNITVFIDEIEVTFLFFDADFCDFLSHVYSPPLFNEHISYAMFKERN